MERSPVHNRLDKVNELQSHPPGRIDPLRAVDLLLKAFNEQHATRSKTVSHKTRHERRIFLRAFFRGLKTKAGFTTIPDPRNLGHKHIRAMAMVWRAEGLKVATVQTYLSYLRTLAGWMNKNGFVRDPVFYGFEADLVRRSEVASYDHSWSAHGIDAEKKIQEISAYDRYVGAQLAVMLAFALRRKEAVMLRPGVCVIEGEGETDDGKSAPACLRIRAGAKGGRLRLVPVDTPQRQAAIRRALEVAGGKDDHLGNPAKDLKQNLQRFDYVMRKFELVRSKLGVTGHGLRHQQLNDKYEEVSGSASPVRGGGGIRADTDRDARTEVARVAGHNRARASGAYLGAVCRWRVVHTSQKANVVRTARHADTASESSGVDPAPTDLSANVPGNGKRT